MEMKVYSIFDKKAASYMSPFFMHQDGMARRSFGDLVNDKQHQLGVNKHPEDYSLYKLGTFDDISGKLNGVSEPEFISNAMDFYIED